MPAVSFNNPPVPAAFPVWPKGKYEATLVGAEIKNSQKSNEVMIKAQLRAYDDEGRSMTLFDYIMMESEEPACIRKRAAFVNAMGGNYESGEPLELDTIINRGVKIALSVQKAKGDYPERNSIQDYIALEGGVVSDSPAVEAIPDPAPLGEADDLPF